LPAAANASVITYQSFSFARVIFPDYVKIRPQMPRPAYSVEWVGEIGRLGGIGGRRVGGISGRRVGGE
jgi:hypothetical protein